MITMMVDPKEYLEALNNLTGCMHRYNNFAFEIGKISRRTLITRLCDADSQLARAEEAVGIINNNSISEAWLVMINLLEQGEWDVVYHLRRLLGATDIRI